MKHDALVPGFLVASPVLEDAHFSRSVVLLLDHEAEGSFGLVINKPLSTTVHDVLEYIDLPTDRAPDDIVLRGGPVSPHEAWILHTPDWQDEDTVTFLPELYVSGTKAVVEAIARGTGPSRFVFLLGTAGWGPGQLEDELREGAWIHAPFSLSLLFDTPIEDRWHTCLSQLGIDPAFFSPTIGGA